MKKAFRLLGLALIAAQTAMGAVATTDIAGKHFFLKSKGRTGTLSYVCAESQQMKTNGSYYTPDFIWTFEKAGDNTFYIQNVGTGKYVGAVPSGDRQTFNLVDKSSATAYTADFTTTPDYVVFYDANSSTDHNALHADDSHRIVRWTISADCSAFSLIDATGVADALTRYYTIKNKNAGYLYYNPSDNNNMKPDAANITGKTHLWHVVNTPEGNFSFVPAADEAKGKVLGITGSDAAARAKVVDPVDTQNHSTEFNGRVNLDGTASYIKVASSDNNYWNLRNGYLAFWNSAAADGDNGSTFYISAVDPDPSALYAEYNSATPGTRPEGIHEFALWYDTPVAHTGVSDTWMEYALPLGNGQLGATIRGGVLKDEIQFNEKTLWAGGTANSNQGYYQNFGSILVTDRSGSFSFDDNSRPVKNYTRYLDIIDGTAGVDYSSADNATAYSRRYFVSATDKVLVARYEATGTDKLDILIALKPDAQIGAGNVTYADAGATFSGGMATVSYNAALKVVTPEGATVTTDVNGISVSNAAWAEIVMAATTDYDATRNGCVSGASASDLASTVNSRISAAVAKGYDSLLADHTAAFSELMNRVSLNLGTVSEKTTNALIDFYATDANKATPEGLYLESLYFQYGRYLTVAANLDRSIHAPSNLQGIWNDRSNSSFWHCDIHADINVQMNYWPADPANLSEMHLPFLEHIIDLASAPGSPWKALAQKIKAGAEGWTVAVENNIFGGTSTWQNARIKTLGAWYCSHLWRYYQYTLDRDLLRRALPVMYDAALFIKAISTPDSNGLYEITDEWSPEHGNVDVTAFAQQTAYELLDNLFSAHAELGADSPLTEAQMDAIRDLYANFDKGLWVETLDGKECISEWKNNPLSDPGHRHLSHLMCLYPYAQVSRFDTSDDGKRLFQAAYNGQIARNGDVTGWSMGWQTNTYARCGDGDRARSNLSRALKHSRSYVIQMSGNGGCYYNLFDAHSPFQIDGNYGCTSGIAEMLLQSFDNEIHILPALPSAWATGSVSGLKAQGDYTVNAAWDEGKCTQATVTNNRNEARSVKVHANGKTQTLEFQPMQTLAVKLDGEGTGISDVTLRKPADATAVVYDLLGRRVAAASRGLYIADGKLIRK